MIDSAPFYLRQAALLLYLLGMFQSIDESEQLQYFRMAYKHVTGQWLRRICKCERPDFICKRPDGTLVGIEFTLLTRDPETSACQLILQNIDLMDGMDGAIQASSQVARKGAKRADADWKLPNSSILVLSTPDCEISEMEYHLDQGLRQDFAESGFTEIWIADYTEVDAYGTVPLFGLFPKEWWGYHAPQWTGKPYG